MDPVEPPEVAANQTAASKSRAPSELGACFWAGLHAAGITFALLSLVPDELHAPWLAFACAAVALWASLRFGFAEPLPPDRSRIARVLRVAFLGALSGSLLLATLASMLDDLARGPLFTLGVLLFALAQRKKRRPAASRARRARLIEAAAWLAALLLLPASVDYLNDHCLSARLRYGIDVYSCPEGKVLQTVNVSAFELRRGGEGQVTVMAVAHFTTGAADDAQIAPVDAGEPTLVLLDARGKQTALKPKRGGWKPQGLAAFSPAIELPKDLPDGDYTLRASVSTRLGSSSVDVALPVYAPARIHVLTDRPIYEPGNLVQFRAVVLRAHDLAPLDGRPGRWTVTDPSGELVLEEAAPAGAYGVASGSFPLDAQAPTGTWVVRWVSNDAVDEVQITVEPFRLPRFRIEATPDKPFHTKGDKPKLRGRVLYSSGAPVADAALELHWTVDAEPMREGTWPAPADWEGDDGTLPRTATSNASGSFELELPVVPDDLRGRVTLHAALSAVDGTGDRVDGQASVKLSADPIRVEAQTELEGGLVEGFNNRLYLRATTADGELLRNKKLRVKRAWQADDPGVEALTDADGVAALQIDPGAAVTVVLAPMPVRPLIARGAPVVLGRLDATDLFTGEVASLADQRTMDGWDKQLEPCGRFVANETLTRTTHVRVSAAGAVLASIPTEYDALAKCVAQVLGKSRFAAGKERLYSVAYHLGSSLRSVSFSVEGSADVPSMLQSALENAVAEARPCIAAAAPGGALPRLLTWTPNPTAKTHALSFVADPSVARESNVVAAPLAACIERAVLAHLTWARDVQPKKEEWTPAIGFARMHVDDVYLSEQAPPEALTVLGYELLVSALDDDKALGETKLVLDQGSVPPLRLRAEPVLAAPGERVAVRVLRGPDYTGELPEELVMRHRHGELKAKLDRGGDHTARFKLPADAKGWFEVRLGEARSLVYVRGASDLAVEVQAGAERYAPGELAQLHLRTTTGGVPARAAVGLFGVDKSLEQLAKLPGPDELGRLRVLPEMRGAALGELDAAALELGRVRGANAAAAAILQIGELPPPQVTDAVVNASMEAPFDAVSVLTDNFYRVFGELREQVRAWEKGAPKSEKMRPAQMAKLWQSAVSACQGRKEPVEDVYGRTLALHILPGDLLALTDPRLLVVDGTRLPEDVENWPAWVAKERP